MSGGPIQIFTVCTASGASSSSMLDLSNKSYSKMAVKYVTMSTGALVSVYGAESATAAALPVTKLVTTTATVAYQQQQITTTNSGAWTIFEPVPFEFVQFVCSAVVSGGVSFTVALCD